MNQVPTIKLVAGLGNPGKQYERTYHNAGKLFAAYFKKKSAGAAVVLPDTFMNESGKAVRAAVRFYRIKPAELLVAHDDSDLEIGNYKLSFGSGAAGHHGVESIIRELGTKDFWRLRIGIRHPQKAGLPAEARRAKAESFVLSPIRATDKKVFEGLFREAAEALSEKQK